MNPLVSVIIPVYNVYDYLEKCVGSVRAQTYTNLEIILVDDGSPDNSGELCDMLAAADDRIRVIHKENGGLSSARNAGLDAAAGEFLFFLDSDDYIDPDLTEKCLSCIIQSACDMVLFGYVHEDSEGRELNRFEWTPGLHIIKSDRARKKNLLFLQTTYTSYGWQAVNRFHRTSFLRDNKLYFPDNRVVFAEDVAHALLCCLYVKRFNVLHDTFYHYVKRDNSIMNTATGVPVSKYRKLFENFEASLSHTVFSLSEKELSYIYGKLLYNVLKRPDWSYSALAESCRTLPPNEQTYCADLFSGVSHRLSIQDMGVKRGLAYSCTLKLAGRILEDRSHKHTPEYHYILLSRFLRRFFNNRR